MAYVTVVQLKAALQDAGGAGSRTAANLPDERLRANIDEATGEVAGRIGVRYTVPPIGDDPETVPDGTPAMLRTITVGIAGYLATLEFYGSQPLEDRDPVALRYARAEKLLGQIAGGQVRVDGLQVAAGDAASGEAAIYQGAPAVGLASGWLEDQHAYDPRHAYGGMVWE